MPRVLLTLVLASMLCSAGCLLQGQGRTAALTDAVHDMMDETRWGRAELAADRVAPAFRARFVQAHARWGQGIEIADLDVSMLRMAQDEESATAILTVNWYSLDTMELSTTRVRQRWEQSGNSFVLARESVVSGDARLLDLAVPAALRTGSDEPATDEPSSGGPSTNRPASGGPASDLPDDAPHVEAARQPTSG